jgi:DNA-binding PadR family transcriptional regulator
MLILRLVEAEPTWGYDIIKKTETAYQVKLRHGALYPMLNKLEAKGFVKSKKELQKGRVRKIYEITMKGKQLLHAYYDSLREQIPEENITGSRKGK